MSLIVDSRTEVLHRFVFELRYDLGQIYWDRAGRIAKTIISEGERWDFNEISINRCQLSRREQNLVFSFGPDKLDLSQTLSADCIELMSPAEFGKVAETLATVVVKYLEVGSFSRIGFRAWHLYRTADREESWQAMLRLKSFAADSESLASLGAPNELSHRLVVDRGSLMARIAIAPFEQQVDIPPSVLRAAKEKAHKRPRDQRHALFDKLKAERIVQSLPHFGVLVDLDAYLEDPPYPSALSVSDFVKLSVEEFFKIKPVALAAKPGGAG